MLICNGLNFFKSGKLCRQAVERVSLKAQRTWVNYIMTAISETRTRSVQESRYFPNCVKEERFGSTQLPFLTSRPEGCQLERFQPQWLICGVRSVFSERNCAKIWPARLLEDMVQKQHVSAAHRHTPDAAGGRFTMWTLKDDEEEQRLVK